MASQAQTYRKALRHNWCSIALSETPSQPDSHQPLSKKAKAIQNQFYGLDWDASVHAIEDIWRSGYSHTKRDADMLISCVDSRAARRRMHAYLFAGDHYHYWLDLGNRQHDAQVVLGQPPTFRRLIDAPERLRCVTERYPELLDDTVPEDDIPSCSVRMSLRRRTVHQRRCGALRRPVAV